MNLKNKISINQVHQFKFYWVTNHLLKMRYLEHEKWVIHFFDSLMKHISFKLCQYYIKLITKILKTA
jgi:hypothetical protein